MVDWAIAEVKYKPNLFNQFDCIEALDGIWKSDTIVPDELRAALEKAVQPLENIPEVMPRLVRAFGNCGRKSRHWSLCIYLGIVV